MNILLTGGSGFVGRNLQEQLADDYHIFAPRHTELDLLDYGVLFQYVKEHRIDAIIHGAIHVPMFNGYEKEFFNDMQMFLNLEKISSMVNKLIYFGSGAEFDKRYHIRNVSEDDIGKTIPDTEYGLAKYTMTKIARKSDNIYNLRLFGIFGKYELWQLKLLSNLCCKAVFDLPLTIRKDCTFNFIYIDDMPDVLRWMLEGNPEYHDYNFCHDQSYKLSELAEMVREISGKNLEIQMLSKELNLDYTASNKRLRAELKTWKITPIMDAIEKLYRYYSEKKPIIDYKVLEATR